MLTIILGLCNVLICEASNKLKRKNNLNLRLCGDQTVNPPISGQPDLPPEPQTHRQQSCVANVSLVQ